MALLAATITDIERRWGVKYIAQLTLRDLYTNGAARDDDVLERGVRQAQFYAKVKRGATDEDHPSVIEMVPYFLVPPGEQSEALAAAFVVANELLVSPPATSSTNALPKDDVDFNGRFDGDDFEDLVDTQSSSRPKRSVY